MTYVKRGGFTVIELLLVCSMIGVLSLTMMPNIRNARLKTKEMATKANVLKMQALLESYYLDDDQYVSGGGVGAAEVFTIFKDKGYIRTIPRNPFTSGPYANSDTEGKIVYTGGGNDYEIKAYGENETNLICRVEPE